MWLVLVALLFFQNPDEGTKALEEQRYEEAAAIFSKIAQAQPKDYSALFHLALAQSLLNRDPEAISTYRKVLELKPQLYEAQLNLGILLLRNKKEAEAKPLLQAAHEQKPTEQRPKLYLADAALATGDATGADKLYAEIIAADEKNASAYAGQCRAKGQLGQLAEARPLLEKAVALDPGYSDLLLELASFHEKAGQSKEAIALYQKFPDNPAAKERLGELLLESGQAETAIPLLEKAVAESPTVANQYALATAYNAQRNYAKAEPILAGIAKQEPNNLGLAMMYGRVLREQKKYEPAAQQFFRATQIKADSVEAWSDLAGMLILLEQDQQAIMALDRVRALGAEKAGHFFFRAVVLDRNKQFEPALASYEQFLAASEGKNPDEEFKARQRVRILKKEVSRR